MDASDFDFFSLLIKKVWSTEFPEMELQSPISGYDRKLCQIAHAIRENTMETLKHGDPISDRSIREFTNAIIDKR